MENILRICWENLIELSNYKVNKNNKNNYKLIDLTDHI